MNLLNNNLLTFNIKNIFFFLITATYFGINANAQINSIENSNASGTFFITPTFSATETYTNNISLASNAKNSGFISEVSPGINILSGTGRVKGYLNYSLNLINYNGGQGSNLLQNTLNSSAAIEVIDGHGFINVSGVISQQTISAFSTQGINNNLNPNKTEVSTYNISPYYRGQLSNFIDYEAKYSLSKTQAKSLENYSSYDNLASLNLNGNEYFGKLSWSLGANRQVVLRNANANANANANTVIDKLNVSFNYPIISKLILSISGGREIQNYTSTIKESSWTSGAGLNWSMSERTKLFANVESSPLGKLHSLNFEHRTPRTSWRINDTKNVSVSNNKNSATFGNNYDIVFNQFSSVEPDPIKRIQLVNNFLRTNGINPDATVINGYLKSGTSIQHSKNISFSLFGIRDTITLTAAKINTNKVINSILATNDFNNSNPIRQSGLTVTYTHRLTENTVFNNQFSIQKITGEVSSQNTELKSVNVSASTRIASNIYLTLSARHSTSSNTIFPYKETALIGNLAVQF